MRLVFFMILTLLLLTSCQNDSQTAKSIDMYNPSGDMVGTAALTEQPDGVQIKLKVEGLSPGFHGIHVHEYAKCKAPDYQSAGNHFNPEGKKHGLMNPEGAHLGDLPNVEADGSGMIDVELLLADVTLLDGNKSIVQKGTSLIIDEGQDDGMSQPGGDSGARIICGEIKSTSDKNVEHSPSDPTQTEKEQEKED